MWSATYQQVRSTQLLFRFAIVKSTLGAPINSDSSAIPTQASRPFNLGRTRWAVATITRWFWRLRANSWFRVNFRLSQASFISSSNLPSSRQQSKSNKLKALSSRRYSRSYQEKTAKNCSCGAWLHSVSFKSLYLSTSSSTKRSQEISSIN